MTLEELKKTDWIVFDGIVGSQAYGTALPTSDIDKKGVYIQPLESILGIGYIEQISNESNDENYYEIRRFLELVATNNPNILETLNLPEDCIVYKHPVFDLVLENRDQFITKICKNSFGGYAVEQIKKARGLNKKIVNPVEPERKSVLDFCYVATQDGKSVPVKNYLGWFELYQENCGLVALDHMRYVYAVYYDADAHFKGIVKNEETSNDISLSSIPKGYKPDFTMYFNKDGYSTYCKVYREYWEWVEKRNEVRYSDTEKHGKNYDAKNLMHCHRLLDMAIEIGKGEGINVRRSNRDQLLTIRRGEYEYKNLVKEAEEKISIMDGIFDSSDLPDRLDMKIIDEILIKIRKQFYGTK
jgi:hypothetical protein